MCCIYSFILKSWIQQGEWSWILNHQQSLIGKSSSSIIDGVMTHFATEADFKSIHIRFRLAIKTGYASHAFFPWDDSDIQDSSKHGHAEISWHLLQASTKEVWVTKVVSMDFSVKSRARCIAGNHWEHLPPAGEPNMVSWIEWDPKFCCCRAYIKRKHNMQNNICCETLVSTSNYLTVYHYSGGLSHL